MVDIIMFSVIFVMQITVISWYFPRKIGERITYVLDKYPQSDYPKLYTKPAEKYRASQKRYVVLNVIIGVIGFVILGIVWVKTYNTDSVISDMIPGLYGILQFMPFMLLEFAEIREYKEMRKQSGNKKRTAPLAPRQLFDFISPTRVFITVGLLATAICTDIAWNSGDDFFESSGFLRSIILLAVNCAFLVIMLKNLYGKKQNPHQDNNDRYKQLRIVMTNLTSISMAASVYFITQAASDKFALDTLEGFLMSLYFIAIFLLSVGYNYMSTDLKSVNFDVYKEDLSKG